MAPITKKRKVTDKTNDGESNVDLPLDIPREEFQVAPLKVEVKTSKKRKLETEKEVKTDIRFSSLSFNSLSTGMSLIGIVKEINELNLLVSLPNNLTGSIHLTQISDQISDQVAKHLENSEACELPQLDQLFHVGQLLRVIIVNLDEKAEEGKRTKHHIELSLRPSLINAQLSKADLYDGMAIQVSVKSVEDHGLSLDLGIKGIHGFIKTDEKSIQLGAIAQVRLISYKKNNRVLQFDFDKKFGKDPENLDNSNITFSSLIPGMVVEGKITNVSRNGLIIRLYGLFDATVDWVHALNGITDLPNCYKVGQMVSGRIIYVYPREDDNLSNSGMYKIGVSLRRDMVESTGFLHTCPPSFKVGQIYEDMKVERISSNRGVFFSNSSFVGFAHISRLSNERVDSSFIKSNFHIGSLHRARAFAYDIYDGVVLLTLKQSVLDTKYFCHDDVKIGQIIPKAYILKLDPVTHNVVVSIDDVSKQRAICPKFHLADVPTLSHPEKKFIVGETCKVRVFAVDKEKNGITVTAKKSLVSSKLPIFENILQIQNTLVSSTDEIWVHGIIAAVKEYGCFVSLFGRIQGFLHNSCIANDISHGSYNLTPGQIVKCRIIDVDNASFRVRLSLLPASSLKNSSQTSLLGHVFKQSKVISILKEGYSIRSNEHTATLSFYNSELSIGDNVKDLVVICEGNNLKVSAQKSLVLLSENQLEFKTHFPAVIESTPEFLFGIVRNNDSKFGLFVSFANECHGLIPKKYLPEDLSFINGEVIVVKILSIENEKINLSLLNCSEIEKLNSNATFKKCYKEITPKLFMSNYKAKVRKIIKDDDIEIKTELKVGDIIDGHIKGISNGLFISTLGGEGRIKICELFDNYVKNWDSAFRIGQTVKCKVIDVEGKTGRIEFSMRPSVLDPSKSVTAKVKLETLTSGQIITGTVANVVLYGVFVDIDNSISTRNRPLRGLCHISELSDDQVDQVSHNFSVGDRVKGIILSVDVEKKRVRIGLKNSYIEATGTKESVVIPSVKEDEQMEVEQVSASEDEDEDGNEIEMDTPAVMWGTSWIEEPKVEFAASNKTDVDEVEEKTKVKKSKAEKKQEEAKIRKIEAEATAGTIKAPETSADFDRLVIASPNSSMLWIQYMAFHLNMVEIEKARQIAEKALQTIHFREEQEKMNIWIAYLNMENTFGTMESFSRVYDRALQYNNPKHIHLEVAKIYDQSGKADGVEQVFEVMTKKFKTSSKVWIHVGAYYYSHNGLETAREKLQRSLQSLPKRKHSKVINKFAQMEFKWGDKERGRTVFEGLLSNYPKRFDLWSVYIDMEIKYGEIKAARRLFERVIMLKASPKSMKFLFKKYLEFEKRYGSEVQVKQVTDSAKAYVASLS